MSPACSRTSSDSAWPSATARRRSTGRPPRPRRGRSRCRTTGGNNCRCGSGNWREAWRDPSAWEGETTVGGVTQPAQNIVGFANDELVLHGWDLANATGQPYEVAAENLEAAWQLVSNIPDDPAARSGLFGPRLPIADDAPLLDRVLAYAGRDPKWTA